MARKRAEAHAEPGQEQESINEPAAAITIEEIMPAREPGQDGDARQYPPEPNPRGWAHNNVVNVEFSTRRDPYQAQLAFKDKPSQAVIDALKDAGFRWNGPDKIWTRPVNYDTQAQDRLVASRTYHKVVDMLLEEKGLAPEGDRTPF